MPQLFSFSSRLSNWLYCWLVGLCLLASLPARAQAPTISSFAPATGVAGTAVTLTGSNLTGATAVTFNGTAAAAFTVNSSTSLTAVVPAGATTGLVAVTAPGGTASSSASFTVLQPSVRSVVVMDGYRERLYGSALTVQANPTGFGNAVNGSQTEAISGSELDAAYAYVSGDSLHVFLAGNVENNNNALDIFFDSQAGGQNTLTTLGNSMPYNNIAGLTFDSGFLADYVLVTNNNNTTTGTPTVYAQFANLNTGVVSAFATGNSRSVSFASGSYTGKLNIDESNTGGVDGSMAYGAAPAGVVTGVEFVLPLAALGSPTGSLKISAFLSNGAQNYLSNQTLGPLPNGTANLASPVSSVNFNNYAGNQYFTVALPPQLLSFSPASGAVGSTVTLTGTGLTGATVVSFNGTTTTNITVNAAGTQLTVTVPAGATSGTISVTTPVGTATSSTSFTVLSAPVISSFTPATGVAGTAVTLTGSNLTGATDVRFNGNSTTVFSVTNATTLVATVPVGATTGPISVTTPGGTATSSTSFTVLQPTAGRILLDGYRESRYGSAAVVQTAPTGFGNSTSGLQNNAVAGSELDAAYTYVHGDSLYVFLGGNLENNGNTIDIFFDSQTGGQNVLAGNNPNVDNNGLNAMNGLTFDTGFTADYYLTVAGVTSGGVVNTAFASLGAAGTGVSPASTGTGRIVTLNLPGGQGGTLAIDQSNTGGVDGSSVLPGAPAAVVTGLEFVLPLAALGSPASNLKIAAFINNGSHNYLSNQVLGGLPAATPNLGGPPSAVNFNSYAGNQYFAVTLPAPTITSFSPMSGPVGTTITLTGTGFAGATAVSIGGTAATTFTVVSGTSITVVVPAGAPAGTVSVTTPNGTVTSATGFCVQYQATVASASRCGTGTLTLGASGAPTGGTYAYYSAATGGTALGSGTAYTTPSLSATTTYYVGITTGSGTNACEGPRVAVTATVNPLPTVSITAGGATTFCQGGSVVLTASGAATYLWSTGATTASITVSASGSYTVTGTSAATAGGCSSTSAATTVTVNPLPMATITAGGATTFCAGGSVVLTASAGSTYAWSNGATTQSITVTQTGSYTVTVSNAAGCSATSAATAVTVNPLPTATITAGGATTFCTGGSVVLTASAGSSYLWSTGATTASITVSASGSYTVTVSNTAGCSATSAATVVTVNPLPTAAITAGGATTFCAGGSVVLTASAGSSYLWSTGATTQSITVTQAGSYTVAVTNGNGCAATSAATAVTVNPLPAQPTVTQTGTGSSTVLTSSATSGNQWYRNGVAIVGATGQTYTPTTSGTYTVVTTSAAGCASPASAGQAVALATTNAALAAQVQVFPNPTQGEVTLTLPGSVSLSAVRVQVLNALGQEVTAPVVVGRTSIQLSLTGLATGVYAVRVQLGTDTLVKRVVLE